MIAALRDAIGAANVLTGPVDLVFYSQDVYNQVTPALVVVRPGSITELAEAVRIANAAGIAIVPRGGGMSHTDGYLPARPESMIVDLLRLDCIVEVNEEDLCVVECGATCNQLHEALVPHGLRTP